MGIKYDSASSGSGAIPGTRLFGVPDEESRSHNRIDKTHSHDTLQGGGNGKSVMFTITIDPQNRFILGESQFTTSAVAWGIHMRTFEEGTEWLTPTGRVRIINGKLRYTSGHRLYPLPKIREATQ